MAGKSPKIALASSVCWKKVGSTVKPWRAAAMPGCSALRSGHVPNSSSAFCHARTVPGTPTLVPLTRWDSKVLSPTNASSFIAAGAVSRESIVWTLPSRAE